MKAHNEIILFLYLAVTCFAEEIYKIETAQELNEYCDASPGCPEVGSNMQCLVETNTKDCWYHHTDLMTDEFIAQIIDKLNEERKKLGSTDVDSRRQKAEKKLPAAKLMHVIKWSSELAEIAHVLADRCDKHVQTMQLYLKAMCKTTKPFPHPRHVGNYTAEFYVYGERQVITPESAATETMDKIYKRWFEGKAKTTSKDIIAYPNNEDAENNNYLNLMNGKATHIGCHLSSYKTYNHKDPNNHIADLLDFQCYLSENITEGQPVYCLNETSTDDSLCKCKQGYRKKDPGDFLCHPEEDFEETNKTEPCGPVMLVMPIIKEVNAPPRKLTTKLPTPETTPKVPTYYNDSLKPNFQRKALQKYLPTAKPKSNNVISRREFSNLRRIIHDYVRKKRVSPVSRPSMGATKKTQAPPVKVSQRFKFDDIDRLIGAIRRANKT